MEEKQKSLITPVLTGLLVISAFFMGRFYTKSQILEDKSKPKAAEENVVAGAEEVAPSEFKIGDIPEVTDEDHIKGDKNAEIVLIEYSDYECPFCNRFNPTMIQIMEEYADKVAWVYRHFPLSFHQNAQKYAEASECVAELGGNDAFWYFNDALYEKMATGFETSQLDGLVTESGVNLGAYQTCMDEGRYTQKVKDQMTAGQAAGVQGTPGTFIVTKNGDKELIPGALPFDQVKPMIDKYL